MWGPGRSSSVTELARAKGRSEPGLSMVCLHNPWGKFQTASLEQPELPKLEGSLFLGGVQIGTGQALGHSEFA